jgi:hypothetical protein
MPQINHLPADEALFLGAALAHVALHDERQRQRRIAKQVQSMRRYRRRSAA